MRKKFISFVSAIYAFTLVTPMISFATELEETGGERLMDTYNKEAYAITEYDEDAIEQQLENNIIYSELTEAYIDNEESIKFDFAGGYINEDDNLVICAAGKDETTDEIVDDIERICSIDTSDVVIEKVKYSYEELEQARVYFEDILDKNLTQAKSEGNNDIYELLSSITSNSIDTEFNKLIVYVPNLNEEKALILENLFDCSDIISFENEEEGNYELRASVCPGRGIYGITSDRKVLRFSVGYRAYFNNGYSNLAGFCTAGHAADELLGTGMYVYSENPLYTSDPPKIGRIYTYKFSGSTDAAFVGMYSGNEFRNSYDTFSFKSDRYFTEIPKNSTVCKVGASTGYTTGKIKSTDYSVDTGTVKLTHQVKVNLTSDNGDSGGLVFMYYNPDGSGGYIPAGLVSCSKGDNTTYTKCGYVVNDLNVYPY